MDKKLQDAVQEAHDAAARAITLAGKFPDEPKATVIQNLGTRYLPRLARLLKEPEPKVPKSVKPGNGKAPKSPKVVVATKPRAKRAPVAVRGAEAGDSADA